ncbi:acyltransferase family protein [Rhizobium leguminosarum]|uniref:acyltransferase family protein n=1 Tax=Rhizobium leguminosarum TaxID=384 RepID=UPI003F9568BE
MGNVVGGGRIGCLDGMRGIAALWVLIGHAHLLTGFEMPIIGDPDLGVDLFIMLSGFLMVFHYQLRRDREPWESPDTWRFFWTRRFCRIAPLYYVLLVVALALGPYLYDVRMIIDAFNGKPPQAATRYVDGSIANYLTHLTFIFGLIPHYAYRTALPDWSIGLEMQFYVALPFLMIIIGRVGWLKGIVGIAILSVVTALAVHRLGVRFPMPTFLPMKMHVFAAGMLLAGALWMKPNRRAYLAFVIATLLVLIPIGGAMTVLHQAVRVCLVALFFGLVHVDRLPRVMAGIARPVGAFLGNRFCHHLGELSFGAYLIHLLVMLPVIGTLIQNYPMTDPSRWAVTLIITVPIVYALAWVGYNFIELQGQKAGKALSRPKTISA